MKKVSKKELLSIVHELQGIGTVEAMQTAAEISAEIEKRSIPRDWLRVLWYSDECGGRLVRFKCGNPYGKQRSKNATAEKCEASDGEEKRLVASLSRTRRRIYEIAACNEWTWFFTGTLDGEKCDRNDLNGTFKRLSQFVRDYRKRQNGSRIVYMIVPEQHKDGAWHFHGLLQGISEAELYKFGLKDDIPLKLKERIKSGTELYTWLPYQKRFGWATLTKVRSHEAVSKYVTKYITKDLQEAAQGANTHLYYASKGLNKPEILAEGQSVNGQLPHTDFENDWVALRSLSERAEAEAIIKLYLGGENDGKRSNDTAGNADDPFIYSTLCNRENNG